MNLIHFRFRRRPDSRDGNGPLIGQKVHFRAKVKRCAITLAQKWTFDGHELILRGHVTWFSNQGSGYVEFQTEIKMAHFYSIQAI